MARWNSWREFEENAINSLVGGSDFLSAKQWRWFQITEVPAFQNPTSWEVLSILDSDGRPKGSTYTVVRMVWCMDEDYPDIDAPDYAGPDFHEPGFEKHLLASLPDRPSIKRSSMTISMVVVDPLIRGLGSLSIPLLPSTSEIPVEDGEMFVAKLMTFGTETRLRWCDDGPVEWNALIGLCMNLLDEMKCVFDSE